MKKLLFFLAFVAIPFFAFSQETAKEKISRGVQFHDQRNYREAIAVYEEVVANDDKNWEAYYEMCLSYLSLKEFKNTIKYADIVIDSDSDMAPKGYYIKGVALDYSGKHKEAIKVFKKGIKVAPQFHSLYYSLAIVECRLEEYDEAENYLQEGLHQNPLHGSSHLLLGKLNYDERTKSLLAFYNFLIIEPVGKRANEALTLIKKNHSLGVEFKDDNKVNITLNSLTVDSEFGSAEMLLSMSQALRKSEEYADKSDFDFFADNTKSFFMVLGELKENKKKKGFWWDYYVDFFYDLANNEEMYETFMYYIHQDIQNTQVELWLQDNPEKVDAFLDWVSNYKRV
ncbi:tetratricopeptide repeat protein [Flavobacterium rakeshii]|uniref:Tetratricopeptide repeat protein n=1 Tax=Flavobacterium rakeshii TaxID=1038845 RepID=A0A6N8HDE7_9FLAO|nr:tetratricopeptide repeat protein [Flavobacterium rakeshii]MUV02427.1 tetratricopeptide repeat protein [Flavobacterium rakeshii]